MFISIEAAGERANELSYLLHKHPDKLQSFVLSTGTAHVFYPRYEEQVCKVVLVQELDTEALAKGAKKRRASSAVEDIRNYVNDRPYAANSITAQALTRVFSSAVNANATTRPELQEREWQLTIEIAALSPTTGPEVIHKLFAPLGWRIELDNIALNDANPQWGGSEYYNVTLKGSATLSQALRQVAALIPVIDDSKHYWVGEDEPAKLLRLGAGWLEEHPERKLVLRNSLAHQRELIQSYEELARTSAATTGLAERAAGGSQLATSANGSIRGAQELPVAPISASLWQERHEAVLGALEALGAHTVADVGCGEGKFLQRLVAQPRYSRILGSDVSAKSLERAALKINLTELSDDQRQRISLIHSSLNYRDDRLKGFEAIVLMEVIEHLETEWLEKLVQNTFGAAAPRAVIVTTPNQEYNSLYPSLSAGTMRHPDHRFEWTRAEFRSWAESVGENYGYVVDFQGIGPEDEEAGTATQMAIFRSA